MRERQDNPGVIAKPPTIYLVAILTGLSLHYFYPLPIIRSTTISWVGLAVIALGLLIMGFSIKEFRKWETPEDTNLSTITIVTSGIYRYSRNPMYLSLTLFLAGIGLFFNSGWLLMLFAPVIAVMSVGVIRREERYLADKFGETYLDYKRSVRRWI